MTLGGDPRTRKLSWLLLSLPCPHCGLFPSWSTPSATLVSLLPLRYPAQEYRTGPGTERSLGSVISRTRSPGLLNTKCSNLCSLCKYPFIQLLDHSEVQIVKYRQSPKPNNPKQVCHSLGKSCFFIHCASWNPLLQVLEA